MKKNRITIIIAIALISFVITSKLSAQEIVKSLQECIDMAMSNNLNMKSGYISIKKAEELQGTAFNIDKTNVTLSQDPTSGGSPDNSISLNQTFDFPTLYGARKGLLKAETKLERSNLEVTRNELIKEISGTYYQLLYAKENIKILQKQDSILGKFLFIANAKLKSGDAGRLEQMNAERLYNENKISLQNADKNYRNIQLVLQRWLNTEEYITPAENVLPVMEPVFPANSFNPEQTPIGEVLNSKRLISEKNLDVVKQGYLPSFNVALRNQALIKSFNPYKIQRESFGKGNFMGFEVGVSVPLFFGEQRAKTKAAKREVEIAGVKQEEVMQSLRKEYSIYLNEYAKAKNALDYYTSKGNKQSQDITRISQISYEKGEINYVEYIQNLKTSVELNLQYANAVNDYNQTIIILKYLQGTK